MKSGLYTPALTLPHLEESPPDEDGLAFRKELAERRQNDHEYLQALEDARENENSPSRRQIERDLRDRVRKDLGLLPRETPKNPDLRNHARLHQIDPSYKLPWKRSASTDTELKALQALWLPDDLDRKLGALKTKYRTSIEETGINVLHLAVGFLDWKDPRQNKDFRSPLLLMPLRLESKRSAQGQVFSIQAETDSMRPNVVLREKLQREFGVDFPAFDPESDPLAYLRMIADAQSPLVA